MALPGPRPQAQKRRTNAPTVNWTEVVDVPFRGAPALPAKRPNGKAWPAPTKRWYRAISTMPHCTLWTASDWMFVEHTARLVAAFDEGDKSLAVEIRQRERKLGATVDDRLAMRIRYVPPAPAVATTPVVDHLAERRRRVTEAG